MMAYLVEILTEVTLSSVQTDIQSGTVICETSLVDDEKLYIGSECFCMYLPKKAQHKLYRKTNGDCSYNKKVECRLAIERDEPLRG